MTSDYKKYSLDKLQEWVHDAMNSDASPHEIYSAIREAVREDYYYHKDCISRATGLLELMSGHRPVANSNDAWEEHYYPEEYDKAKQEYLNSMYPDVPEDGSPVVFDYTATGEKFPIDKAELDAEVEAIRKEGGYEWTPEHVKKKWVLPVEQFAGSEEYLISFPDDLLKAANLKEGDEVEWVDQGDGSYLIKKVVKPMTYNDMIAAGYTMTADGFWIKE